MKLLRRMSLASVTALAGTVFASTPPDGNRPCATDPTCFRASDAVLEAVEGSRVVVTIRDAGSMVSTPAGAALRSFVATLAKTGIGSPAATSLVRRLSETPKDGFTALARHELRLALRDDGRWVAFARLEACEQREFLAAVKPVLKADGSLVDEPSGMVFRSMPGWLAVGSDGEIVPGCLPDCWGEPEAAGAGTAKIEAAARRQVGGDTLRVVGECEGERLSLRFRFRGSGHDPIPGPWPSFGGPGLPIEDATLDRLAADAIVCEIASMRRDLAPEDGTVLANLPEIRLPATFRRNLGPRRVTVVGEVEGQGVAGLRCPAIAIACEVEDPTQAMAEQDALVSSILAGLRRRFEADPESAGAMPEPTPSELARRSIPLERPVERFAGRSPWFAAVEMAWSVVDGERSDWQVYASHPELQNRVAAAMAATETCASEDGTAGQRFVSVGRFDGQRLARHLEGWIAARDRFEPQAEGFWDGIAACARLARHVPQLDWKASRHGPSILVEIEARLAEP